MCRGNPRALCCSQFTAGVHPSPCWLGAPIIPGMVPYLIKITPCIPSLHNLLCILQDAWKGPVLLGGHSGVLSPAGTPVLLAAAGEHGQAPAGCVGSPPPLLPPRILLAVYLAGHVQPPPAASGDSYSGQEETSEEVVSGLWCCLRPRHRSSAGGKAGLCAATFSPILCYS